MVTNAEYQKSNDRLKEKITKMTREYHEAINIQKAYTAQLACILAEAQSNLRYKDKVIAEKEVEIDALKRRIRDAKILGRGIEEA